MNDRPTDLSSLPSYQAPRRSLFSARKFALMASVVAGLGVAVYGFGPSHGPVDIFTSPAHAQVDNEVIRVQKPVGFADIVERVKPSVISVKVNINEKVAKDDSNNDDSPFQPGSPMERFFRRFGGPDGLPPGLRGAPRGHGVVTAHRPGADQGRGRFELPVRQAFRRQAPDRRLGARGRQPVRPGRYRDCRHCLGQGPRHRQRPV